VLGELTYAYVVGRVDISSYAITILARYLSTPDRCHDLALKRLCKYLRRTIDGGILYYRVTFYPPVTSRSHLKLGEHDPGP
jgi:hypothetical protein